ncbi:MAG: excalibur calcium-binding domain-containing protein [Chloroflexota bacterium]|nr:excalibur calcium-binding domain-containing protein [Chloroflexota bacterium]
MRPTTQLRPENCDAAHLDLCLPPLPPALKCGNISYRNVGENGRDPHHFDGDNDGIGCER